MRRIYLERKEKAPMARLLGCSVQHVNSALRGDKDSELVMQIRTEALKRGGFYIPTRKRVTELQDAPVTNGE
jgi:hypothetical protein